MFGARNAGFSNDGGDNQHDFKRHDGHSYALRVTLYSVVEDLIGYIHHYTHSPVRIYPQDRFIELLLCKC